MKTDRLPPDRPPTAAGSSEQFQVYFSTMSKNNVSSDFRKTNIDEFDENNFVDEDDGGENQGGPDEAEVDGFLRQYPYMASFFFFFFSFFNVYTMQV